MAYNRRNHRNFRLRVPCNQISKSLRFGVDLANRNKAERLDDHMNERSFSSPQRPGLAPAMIALGAERPSKRSKIPLVAPGNLG